MERKKIGREFVTEFFSNQTTNYRLQIKLFAVEALSVC